MKRNVSRRFSVAVLMAITTAGGFGIPASYGADQASPTPAETSAKPDATASPDVSAKSVYEAVKPSLVAVKYTLTTELGSQELTAAGMIISADGLVAFPIGIVMPQLVPNDQMKSFKIIVPSETGDETEIDATLQGRDERSSLAFVKADKPQSWKPLSFVDEQPGVGETVYSVGLLPKNAGYKAYVTTAKMDIRLRGPVPQILVDGNLAGVGSVVLDSSGKAIGYVHARNFNEATLDNIENPDDMVMITNPPRMFIPSSDFLISFTDPPTPQKPIVIPWIGCEMKGLEKEDAEYYGLENVPAVQIGNIIADGPADKAGLKRLDVVVKINGQPLQRGDVPLELPAIVTHNIQRLHTGDKVTFSIIDKKGDTPRDVVMTLEDRPKQRWEAHRYYAEDLGFVVRDVTFGDTYIRKIKPDSTGVVVALLRQQASAQAAKLSADDMITQMNGKAVTNLDEFKKDYLQARKDRPNDPVVLEVSQPDGREQTINIEPPQNGAQPGAR